MDASARAALLREVAGEAAGCTRCPLADGRTQVVFGEGSADAELVLVGESPGFHEDREGRPFAGRARDLLERLLGSIGLSLDDAYLATVVKCRPPGNREPLPEEAAACEPYLYRQLELVRPTVVATLGTFATTLLSGRALGITRVHGREQPVTLGGRTVTLYPLYHPAAALYTPAMLAVLERDVARLGAIAREPKTRAIDRRRWSGGTHGNNGTLRSIVRPPMRTPWVSIGKSACGTETTTSPPGATARAISSAIRPTSSTCSRTSKAVTIA